MQGSYAAWLQAQGYSEKSCASRQANVRTVERAYGEDLGDIQARGGLRDLVQQLVYSSEDQRRQRPNPSKAVIQGDLRSGLATLKGAVMLYAKFLGEAWEEPISDEPIAGQDRAGLPDQSGTESQKLALEKDMQRSLRRAIETLEHGLTIIDDGAERAVLSGFIDILARDADGATVVIELKAGKTDARVIGQVLGYMGDIADEDEPGALRGIVVAHDFDQRTRSAARAVPNLKLVRYSVTFHFSDEV